MTITKVSGLPYAVVGTDENLAPAATGVNIRVPVGTNATVEVGASKRPIHLRLVR